MRREECMNTVGIRRKLRAVSFQLRQARVVAQAMKSRHHPIVAHIVPIRRCNLACTYCNEFDNVSKPVPLEAILRRISQNCGSSPRIVLTGIPSAGMLSGWGAES